MSHKRILLLLLTVIFIVSCDNDDPTKPETSPPTLSNLTIPDTIVTKINQRYIISVKVADDDGLTDIATVEYEIFNEQGNRYISGEFYDDGQLDSHGDNIAKDGKYSARLNSDFPTGSYRLVATATDQSELESEPLEKAFQAVEGVSNQQPTLAAIQIPDTVFVDNIVPFIIQVRAEDPDTNDYILKVTYQILGPTISELAEEGQLYDNGDGGDSTPGDGIYSVETTTAFASWKFGNYYLFIQAFDSHQKASESIYKVMSWGKTEIGVPPVVSDVTAPDSIKLPDSGAKSFLLTIKAMDADNNNDVKDVFFNTFKPDGTPSSGNPFKMYDDGGTDDAVADDNIYSLKIYLTATNSPGDYRFEFQAQDYSNLLSNKIIHTITVTK